MIVVVHQQKMLCEDAAEELCEVHSTLELMIEFRAVSHSSACSEPCAASSNLVKGRHTQYNNVTRMCVCDDPLPNCTTLTLGHHWQC